MGLVERLNELGSMRQNGQISDSEYALLVESATKNFGTENTSTDPVNRRVPYESVTVSSRKVAAEYELINAPRDMKFIETIKFSYKNYAKFNGRGSRSEYWYWVLYNILAGAGLLFFSSFAASDESPLGALLGIFILSSIIPNVARLVRRLHDTNKPWTYALFALIPLVGNILLTVWFCTKSDVSANRFGPSALSRGQSLKSEVAPQQTFIPMSEMRARESQSSDPYIKTSTQKKLFLVIAIILTLFGCVLQAHVQYGKLIGAIEISEEQMLEINNKTEELSRKHIKPTGFFFSDEDRAEWEKEEKYLSGVYESRIKNAGKAIDSVLLMPWNFNHQAVKSNYLSHNLVWQKRLGSLKNDPYSWLHRSEIGATWNRFCRELKSSIPWYSLGRFDSRIAKICISDADPSAD